MSCTSLFSGHHGPYVSFRTNLIGKLESTKEVVIFGQSQPVFVKRDKAITRDFDQNRPN